TLGGAGGHGCCETGYGKEASICCPHDRTARGPAERSAASLDPCTDARGSITDFRFNREAWSQPPYFSDGHRRGERHAGADQRIAPTAGYSGCHTGAVAGPHVEWDDQFGPD